MYGKKQDKDSQTWKVTDAIGTTQKDGFTSFKDARAYITAVRREVAKIVGRHKARALILHAVRA